jgi:hypothetical protein
MRVNYENQNHIPHLLHDSFILGFVTVTFSFGSPNRIDHGKLLKEEGRTCDTDKTGNFAGCSNISLKRASCGAFK